MLDVIDCSTVYPERVRDDCGVREVMWLQTVGSLLISPESCCQAACMIDDEIRGMGLCDFTLANLFLIYMYV
jgi:hypothetical protein